jgi:hypothetical protein
MMFSSWPQRGTFWLTFALLAFIAGCSSEPARSAVYPVKGMVKVKGKPASDYMVIFHPATEMKDVTFKPSAAVGADGSFAITTFKTGDGAPPGDYVVTLAMATREAHPSLPPPGPPPPARYQDAKTSPLRAKVEAKPANELPPFEVTP